MVGDDLRGMLALSLIGVTFIATAVLVHPVGASAIALAYAATCAWTDAMVRRVYLPVSILAGLLVVAIIVADGGAVNGALGAAALGGFGLTLHLLTRGRGFGFGDVTNWAIVGGALGAFSGLEVVGAGSVIGAFVVVALIASGVLDRRCHVPMALFTFVGMIVVMWVSTAGVIR
jgi:hypothetical protein